VRLPLPGTGISPQSGPCEPAANRSYLAISRAAVARSGVRGLGWAVVCVRSARRLDSAGGTRGGNKGSKLISTQHRSALGDLAIEQFIA
jgi:hypothetical protein